MMGWVNLQKRNSFFIIRYFLKFHNFIIIVNGLLIQAIRKQVNYIFVDIFNIEYLSYLNVQDLFVILFAKAHLVCYVDFVVPLSLNFRVFLIKYSLNLNIIFLHFIIFLNYPLPMFFYEPTTHYPSINLICNHFLL